MKYVSIDIETTGLDPENCQILEFGAIIEDSTNLLNYYKIPKFHRYLKHTFISGSEYALNLNAKIIETIQNGQANNIIKPDELTTQFANWLFFNGFDPNDNGEITITVAGKNFARFDYRFIEKLPYWNNLIKIRHRIIDPSLYYINWKQDTVPPSLDQCLERAGFNKKVQHLAIEDAWNVVELLRKFY